MSLLYDALKSSLNARVWHDRHALGKIIWFSSSLRSAPLNVWGVYASNVWWEDRNCANLHTLHNRLKVWASWCAIIVQKKKNETRQKSKGEGRLKNINSVSKRTDTTTSLLVQYGVNLFLSFFFSFPCVGFFFSLFVVVTASTKKVKIGRRAGELTLKKKKRDREEIK